MYFSKEYKEDSKDAENRMMAWWDHEIIDRPAIQYYMPRPDVPIAGAPDFYYIARNPDFVDEALDDFEKKSKALFHGGELFPCYFPNYGPGVMASVFGADSEFKSSTVWFHKKSSINDIVEVLESAKLNQNNTWYRRLLRTTEVAAKRAKGKYSVAITDLGGVLDILSSFLTPTGLILGMRRHPGIIDTCREIILEKMLRVYKDLQDVVDANCGGCSSWMNMWCKKRWYPVQCDFSAMLSPKYFKRFALPDIITQAESLDYVIYHLDGPDALIHLDSLLKIPQLTGIQWVPGAGSPLHGEHWLNVYKKIQDAEKNLCLDVHPEIVSYLYRELDPKGLMVTTIFIGKILADFYLPTFIGGRDGIDEDEDDDD